MLTCAANEHLVSVPPPVPTARALSVGSWMISVLHRFLRLLLASVSHNPFVSVHLPASPNQMPQMGARLCSSSVDGSS